MSSDWTTCTLGELGPIKTGKTPPSSLGDGFGGTVPFVTPGDMNGHKWITNTDRYLNENGLIAVSSSLMPARSVAISCIGSDMGKAALLSRPSVTNQQINTIAVDESRFNAEFVYYDLSVRQQQLKAAASGSATPILNKGHFSTFEISVPPRGTQDKIAEILGRLDDKIAVNRRINQTLEAMAQAIFKSWFVDLDPVKAKIAAKQSDRDPLRAAMSAISGKPDAELDALSPEQFDQLATTAALFPDEMEVSALGRTPRGWTVGTIGDLAEVTIGGDWGKDQPENEQYIQAICLRGVDLEHLRTGGDCPKAPIRWVKSCSIEKRQIQSTDVLIGGSGAGPCGRPLYASSLIAGLVDHPIIYSNFVKKFRCDHSSIAIYLDNILWDLFDSGAIHNYINGTSVPNLNDKSLLTHPIILPDSQILKEFEKVSENWLKSLYSSESRTLAALRDTLIPKLLSGVLSVTNAVSEIEA